MNLLQLESLAIAYGVDAPPAVNRVNLDLVKGSRLAVLGESGSGKSTLALAIAGLLPREAFVQGEIRWSGVDGLPRMGRDIGFVFQDPSGSLDPLMRVGDQIAEVIREHVLSGREVTRGQVVELLTRVQLPNPSSIARAYPHQLSGGQKQRVAIACAIAADPTLLIADEPTSALDTIVQAEILELLGQLVRDRSMTLLLITHDIAVAAQNADRIAVMRGGQLVEVGSTDRIIRESQSAYTRALIASHIALDAPRRVVELAS